MTQAVGLAICAGAALLPVACLIALVISIVHWTRRVGPPPPSAGGSGGLRVPPRPPRPHGGPGRRHERLASVHRRSRETVPR